MRHTDYISDNHVVWSMNAGLALDEAMGMVEYKYGGIDWIKNYEARGWLKMNKQNSMECDCSFKIAVRTFNDKTTEEKQRIIEDVQNIINTMFPSKYGTEVIVFSEKELNKMYQDAYKNKDENMIGICREIIYEKYVMYDSRKKVAYPKDMDFEGWVAKYMKA